MAINPLPAFFGGAKIISSGLDFAQNHFIPIPAAVGFPLAAASNLGNKLYNHLAGTSSSSAPTQPSLPYLSGRYSYSRYNRYRRKRYKRRYRKTYRLRKNGKKIKKVFKKTKKAVSSRL